MTPDCDFNAQDDREKKRFGYCIWCKTSVLFYISIKAVRVELYGYLVDIEGEKVLGNHILGVSLVTDIAVMKWPDNCYEARAGVAIMGNSNFESSEGANPFDPNFHDNYCSGKGKTLQEALDKLKEDIEKISGSLWT